MEICLVLHLYLLSSSAYGLSFMSCRYFCFDEDRGELTSRIEIIQNFCDIAQCYKGCVMMGLKLRIEAAGNGKPGPADTDCRPRGLGSISAEQLQQDSA